MSRFIVNTATILIAITSCLFVYKYAAMADHYPLLADMQMEAGRQAIDLINRYPLTTSLIYAFVLLLLSRYGAATLDSLSAANRLPTFITIVMSYLACAGLMVYLTDQQSITVDRWSVITSFWDAVHRGEFPYAARSHLDNVPGPLPGYFLIAYPFYLLGDIGYLSIAGCLLLFFVLYNYHRSGSSGWAALLLVVFSASVFWEILARSTVLTTSTLVAAYMVWLIRGKFTRMPILLTLGCIGGLLQSTRSVYVLAFIVCYFFVFLAERRFREFLVVAGAFTVTFLLSLVPFALMDFEAFLRYNPFTLQASFVGFKVIAVFVALAVFAGFCVKSQQQMFFSVALLIFGVVSVYLLRDLYRYGFQDILLESGGDISYLILALPFLLLSIEGERRPSSQ